MLVSRDGPVTAAPPRARPVRPVRCAVSHADRSPAAVALALAELVDLDQMLQAARVEIRVERRRLEHADYSIVGARLAVQAAPWIQPTAGRLLPRARTLTGRGTVGAQLGARASELSAAEPAEVVARAAALLAAKADVPRAELRARAWAAWAGRDADVSAVAGPGQAGRLAEAVLVGTAPAVHGLPPRAATRLAAVASESELFADPEPAGANLGARLSSAWQGAARAAIRGRLAPAAALLSGVVEVFWLSGDGTEAPFVIGAIAALLNPATALGLTVHAADAPLVRNRRRFHLRLAGLLLAPFPAR